MQCCFKRWTLSSHLRPICFLKTVLLLFYPTLLFCWSLAVVYCLAAHVTALVSKPVCINFENSVSWAAASRLIGNQEELQSWWNIAGSRVCLLSSYSHVSFADTFGFVSHPSYHCEQIIILSLPVCSRGIVAPLDSCWKCMEISTYL